VSIEGAAYSRKIILKEQTKGEIEKIY